MFKSTPLLVRKCRRITFRACSSVPVAVTAGKQLFECRFGERVKNERVAIISPRAAVMEWLIWEI